jgi:protein-tyrosine phosphatase
MHGSTSALKGFLMKKVLFLCSGNYYRSRFAEHFFNWLADNEKLPWRADSRGIIVGRHDNPGPISRAARERLEKLGISLNGHPRYPRQVTEQELSAADLVIAVKEAEHREMLDELFPGWSNRVEYWQIDDLDFAGPEEALPQLEEEVRSLFERLADAAPRELCRKKA